MTLSELLRQATDQIAAGGSPSPRLDAEALLAFTLGKNRAWLYGFGDETPTAEQVARFQQLVTRREAGEPVAYLTGQQEFWSLMLNVTPATLIPRPETELLVEQALKRIPEDTAWRIADLGTGSGAIALALAHDRPQCQVIATDISGQALEVASGNAHSLGLDNVSFHQGSWFDGLGDEQLNVIVSNPPYVADNDPHLSQGDCRFEPDVALSPGNGADGLEDLRQIAQSALGHLQPGGWLLMEHGYDQGEATRTLLTDAGYREVNTAVDMEGRDRVVVGKKPD